MSEERLRGMMATMKAGKQRNRQRLWVLIGAILIQMAYGLIYAWQILAPHFSNSAGHPVFAPGQPSWIFVTVLFMLAAGAIVSGFLMDRVGVKKLVVASALVSGIGYLLGSFFADTFFSHLFFTGVFCGFGIGLGYVVPIAVGFRWFPEKRGCFAGLAASGFVLGALVWINSADSWFGLMNTLSFCGLDGVRGVFALFGILSAFLILLGSIGMTGESPSSASLYGPSSGSTASISSSAISDNLAPIDLVRTPHYAMISVGFLLVSLSGLMVINAIAPFGFAALRATGFESQLAFAASNWAMAALFIMGIAGGVLWGSIADSIGSRWSGIALCLLQGLAIFFLYKMGGGAKPLIFSASIIGAGVVGGLVLFPVLMADYFGLKRIAVNYSLILPAYAIAGMIGTQLGGAQPGMAVVGAGTAPSVWFWPFVIGGVCCLVAAAVLFFAKLPGKRRQ